MVDFTSTKANKSTKQPSRINSNNELPVRLDNCRINMATREFRHLIEDLEEETWQVLQRSGSAMVPYLAPDCVMQFPLGMKLTRDTVPSVQDILHSSAFVPWKSYRMSKIDVTPVGKDGAVISYLVQATRVAADPKDEDVTFEALCCSVWRMNDDGKFKMCFHQQSLTT